MNTINNFFILETHVEGISENDYTRIMPMIEAFDMVGRLSYKSFYILDFYKKNILYVSDNPFFLCGNTPAEIKKMGVIFHGTHVPEEEQGMLVKINRVGFDFLKERPIEDRLKLTFSCDFHILNNGRRTLINHKLTPFTLSGNGNIWLAGCLVSLSSWSEPGHIEVWMKGETIRHWIYSLQNCKWELQDGIILTDREKEILLLSAQGLTMNDIIKGLNIGTDGLKSRKRKLFEKLRVNNIAEAIQVAVNYNLI
jgi:DNA-binding CsgD family transcriptional regulator